MILVLISLHTKYLTNAGFINFFIDKHLTTQIFIQDLKQDKTLARKLNVNKLLLFSSHLENWHGGVVCTGHDEFWVSSTQHF